MTESQSQNPGEVSIAATTAEGFGHLRINRDRLWATLSELGEIGAYDDKETGLQGVCRLALTDEDIAGRELVLGWMTDAGLDISIDAIGNVFACREGTDSSADPVMIGSHIDSVATAGRFDGCLGVLGGLEIARTLNDTQIETRRPLIVAIFTEEEGARFGTDMLGSATAVGRIGLESAYARADRDGITVGEELERHGLKGALNIPMAKPHAYFECHIEQGPILTETDTDIGVVTGVQAINWKELHIQGLAAHAGTTPHRLRRNAGLAASLINVRLTELVESGKYGELRVNVGRMEIRPGLINIVPSQALMTIDLRNTRDEEMHRAEEELNSIIQEVTEEYGVEITMTTTAQTPAVDFAVDMMDRVEKSASNLGLTSTEIMSGAGHDAGEVAAIAPTGMVFVPGLYDGISHNPREYSTPEACENGVNTLLHAVLDVVV